MQTPVSQAANSLRGGEASAVQVEQQGDRELRSGTEPFGEVAARRHNNCEDNRANEHGQQRVEFDGAK